jgi:hypothetical protein
MSPQDQVRALDAFIASAEIIPMNVRGGREFVKSALLQMKAQLALPVVFRHLGSDATGRDAFEIGYAGETRTVATRCRGVWATWWLLDDAGRAGGLPAASLTNPDAREPEASVRKAIRVTAVRQFEYWGVPQLCAAALACGIRAGVVTMELPCNAPRFLTR